MTSTDKEYFEGSFNLKTSINKTMHTLFYSTISEFVGNLEVILDYGTCKTNIQNIHKLGWKAPLFKLGDVLMLGHGCGVSQYTQFYDRIKYRYQMSPRLYVGSYSGKNGHQFLQEPWILALSKSVKTFIMVSISDMPTVQYWKNLGIKLDKAKDKIPKQFRIGDTCFMSLATNYWR